MFHGKGRDVEGYYRTAQEATELARQTGNTALVAPQFLDEADISAHGVTADVLRWHGTEWEGGVAAVAPVPISSYQVVDLLLKRLGDRTLFPNLKTIVLAGHSGGGQLVQRYAVVGQAFQSLVQNGIQLRFVAANPSSYLYFDDKRPSADGSLAIFSGVACPDFNSWKYGIVKSPSYVAQNGNIDWAQMEAAYAQREVIYLLGTDDTDPHEKDLDISCAAEAQGPTRFARGKAYYAYLRARHPSDWSQHMRFVPGVAHSARMMFTSSCGVAALFDVGKCPDQ